MVPRTSRRADCACTVDIRDYLLENTVALTIDILIIRLIVLHYASQFGTFSLVFSRRANPFSPHAVAMLSL